MADPERIVAMLLDRRLTLATAESLTAGLVAATMADVPGCSSVLQGGVVAYQSRIKRDLLGVPEDALSHGVVSEPVARAMAAAARRLLSSDVGIGTTGVAGPDPHEGSPVGSVWIAVAAPEGTRSRHLSLSGDRTQIRRQTVSACWDLLTETLEGWE
jgi:nicotinamide-nucleotide amidase